MKVYNEIILRPDDIPIIKAHLFLIKWSNSNSHQNIRFALVLLFFFFLLHFEYNIGLLIKRKFINNIKL